MASIFYEENRLVFQKIKASNYIKNDRSLKKSTFCFMTGGETTSAWATFRPDSNGLILDPIPVTSGRKRGKKVTKCDRGLNVERTQAGFADGHWENPSSSPRGGRR